MDTPLTAAQITVLAILALSLVLFAWGHWRHDVVAIIALASTVVAGIVSAEQAFSGFGHPAVITVAFVLIISHALKLSGIVDAMARFLVPLVTGELIHIVALTAVVALASAFMNNVGALALMLPVALATAAQHDRPTGILLMPLAFGSILGGMSTMIGTPPNIIIATIRGSGNGEPFSMFDFSPVGAPVAIAGVVFVGIVGWRLLPKSRRQSNVAGQLYEIGEYLTEVRVTEDSKVAGQRIRDVEELNGEDVQVIGLARGNQRERAVRPSHVLDPGDVLLLHADPGQLSGTVDKLELEIVPEGSHAFEESGDEDRILVEGVVSPGSALDGRDSATLHRRAGAGVSLMAVARQGRALRTRLRSVRFRAGDILLLECAAEQVDSILGRLGLIPLASRDLSLGRPGRKLLAVGIFAAAIAIGVSGWLPLTVAFLLAILAYLFSGILPVRELYDNIDWPVIVLLGAMIPVGQALESTGTTTVVAHSILAAADGWPALAVLTIVLVVTMFLSDIVNNAATAVIMAPISISLAASLDANPDAFLMAVAVGASCAFLTPIGHQSNTLVMGPGGYRFSDYWRMGLPLEALIVALSVPLIAVVWPL
jgi:di/tricarboxylate transporter